MLKSASDPSPVTLRLVKAPEHDTLSPRERAVGLLSGDDGWLTEETAVGFSWGSSVSEKPRCPAQTPFVDKCFRSYDGEGQARARWHTGSTKYFPRATFSVYLASIQVTQL